jgi:hypothetical protein
MEVLRNGEHHSFHYFLKPPFKPAINMLKHPFLQVSTSLSECQASPTLQLSALEIIASTGDLPRALQAFEAMEQEQHGVTIEPDSIFSYYIVIITSGISFYNIILQYMFFVLIVTV